MKDVVSVQPLTDYQIRVVFDDGVEGIVNVRELVPFSGVFEPLKDAAFFKRVDVNAELGIVRWPNDADLDSDVLYAKVTGTPIPDYVAVRKTP